MNSVEIKSVKDGYEVIIDGKKYTAENMKAVLVILAEKECCST